MLGLFVTGNYLGGVATTACIDSALAVAARADAFLKAMDVPEGRIRLTTSA